jgi:nucleoside-diphosphate-sugar epimerase
MIIGRGLVARAFAPFESDLSVVIFASGVSDSTCVDESAYAREVILLDETICRYPEATLVYFSTTGVKDPDLQATRYVQHKKFMEERILNVSPSFAIFRVSNIVGPGGNKQNILNYFIEKIRNGEFFDVWAASYRNFIGISEVYTLAKTLLADGRFLNRIVDLIAPESFRIIDLVEYLGSLLGIKPHFDTIARGGSPAYDFEISTTLIRDYKLDMGPNYQRELIKNFVQDRD